MKKYFHWPIWVVLAALLIGCIILTTTPLFNGSHKSTAYAASSAPAISVPAVIRAFRPFKISGKGFHPGDAVTVYSTGSTIGTFHCGHDGRFTGTAIVRDPVVQGTHQLTANSNSNLTASASYTYLPGLVLYGYDLSVLQQGGPGTSISLAGEGFRANEDVNVYWGKNVDPIAQAKTDSIGTLDARFNAPTGIAAGTYPIIVKRIHQKTEAASTNFTVLPAAFVSSGGILSGQAIKVKLSGFQANEQVTISWKANKGQTLATVAVDSNGAANTNFTPPSAAKGTHTLSARGNISGLHATSVTDIGPGIVLDPATVNVTGTTTVNGGGYRPGEKVRVYLQKTSNGVTTATVNKQGSFSVPLTVPATYQTNVTYYVYAVSTNGAEKAKDQLFFQPPSISHTGAEVYGESFSIMGRGFARAETVTLSWQSAKDTVATQLGTVVAAPDGTFMFTTTVPAAPYTAPGFYSFNATITALGSFTKKEATTTFYVEHNIIATPDSGTVGSTIALIGGGFGSGEQIALSLQGIALKTVTADANGSFSTTFVVPQGARFGNYQSSLTAVGSTTRQVSDVSFDVLLAITITPQQGASGTSITVSGSGFPADDQVSLSWFDPTTNGKTALATVNVSSSVSTFTTTVTAPANLSSGTTYYVEATDTFTGGTIKAAFVAQ